MRTLGFKDPEDPEFQKIVNNPIKFAWVIHNIIKDDEIEAQKLKNIMFFINPQIYSQVFKDQDMDQKVLDNVMKIWDSRKAVPTKKKIEEKEKMKKKKNPRRE